MEFQPKESLKTLRIIHFALMGGITIFSIVILFLYYTDGLDPQPNEMFDYIPIVLFVVAMPTSSIMFKQTLKTNLNQAKDLQGKMAAYQTAHIVRLAILEGCALFSAVIAFITANMFHLIVVGLIIAFFIAKIPTPNMLESELGLSPDEKSKF